jgi:hypothetical protein
MFVRNVVLLIIAEKESFNTNNISGLPERKPQEGGGGNANMTLKLISKDPVSIF